jgi:hypothetical protein
MSNSVIGNEEYRELMRKQATLTLKAMFWIFIAMGIAIAVGGLSILLTEDNNDWIPMIIIAGCLITVSIVLAVVSLKSRNKTYTNIYFEQYVDYQTTGTKIPLYRIISTGKSSQTIYMVLDIVDGIYKLYDIRRKKLKLYFEDSESNIRVKFFYKTRHGLDIIKPRIQFFVSGKKYSLYGMAEVNDLFLNFLKNEGLNYEVQTGRAKSL